MVKSQSQETLPNTFFLLLLLLLLLYYFLLACSGDRRINISVMSIFGKQGDPKHQVKRSVLSPRQPSTAYELLCVRGHLGLHVVPCEFVKYFEIRVKSCLYTDFSEA